MTPMAYETPEYHPAFEEYCETIYELAEDDVNVIQARMAERLNVSRPAVSEMVRRLEREGLIAIDGSAISLTADGLNLATTVVRRHRLAEVFLTEVLGLSWAEAHHEAGKWEHVISPVVEDALVKVLDDPGTCPHGNPIPGSGYQTPSSSQVLSALSTGATFVVERITEELEFRPGMLDYLESSCIIPGNSGTITAMSPDGTATIDIEGQTVGVGVFAATRILVNAT